MAMFQCYSVLKTLDNGFQRKQKQTDSKGFKDSMYLIMQIWEQDF